MLVPGTVKNLVKSSKLIAVLFLVGIVAASCSSPKEEEAISVSQTETTRSHVKKGDLVKIEYEGKLDDGTVFDKSKPDQPLEFVAGDGKVIKGFDEGVNGMTLGESKSLVIAPEDAYGAKNDKLFKNFPKTSLPKDFIPKEGMVITLQDPNGRPFPAKINKINDKDLVLDLNHPLAGKTLHFKVKVVAIN